MDRLSRNPVLGSATVLIVEDEDIVARAMQRRLERLEFEVVVCADEGSVIESVQASRPDVVLMDVGLGGQFDGITIAEEILVCEDVPVVLISGNIDDDLRRRAARSGAYGFLSKPSPIESIVATLQMAVFKHGELRKQERDARRFAQALDALDAGIIVLRDGDVEMMNRAATELTGTRLAEIKVRRPDWAEKLAEVDRVVLRNDGNGTITCKARSFTMPDGEKVVLLERVVAEH